MKLMPKPNGQVKALEERGKKSGINKLSMVQINKIIKTEAVREAEGNLRKRKVYIMGPKQIAGKSYIPFYKNIVKFCKGYFEQVVCTYPDFWNSTRTPKEHYKFIRKQIAGCRLLVAEVSTPATGLSPDH